MRYLALILVSFFLVTCTATPAADTPTPITPGTPFATLAAPASPAPTRNAQPTRKPIPTVVVDEKHIQELAQGNAAFALDLYRQAVKKNTDQNLIFSPYSISLAFSMLYAGARGNTETQLADTFHFLPQDTQHLMFNALAQRVTASPPKVSSTGKSGTPFQLNIANATWGQQSFPFLEPFNQVLREQYHSTIRQVDFTQDSDIITTDINRWIADSTQDRIKNLIGSGVLDAKTRLVLVNAVYFHGSWQLPFNARETNLGIFTLADNSTIQVPFMSKEFARISYLETANYQAFAYPYQGDKADMLFILPKAGRFQDVENSLTPAAFGQIRAGKLHDADISVPRFKFETNLPLPRLLQSLGVTDAFDARADFSALSQGGGLYLSDALHRALISVDETGTEAAAATVLPMASSAYERAEINLNRPFLFAILERETNTILFLGRVMNPAP